MQTATHSEGLVVWTEPKALDEAKSLFAPYSPRFQTVPCDLRTALGKTQVSVHYLSSSEEDAAVESTLATLRNCKVSTLLVYTPHHSADFAPFSKKISSLSLYLRTALVRFIYGQG
jgi:hypothetical protein